MLTLEKIGLLIFLFGLSAFRDSGILGLVGSILLFVGGAVFLWDAAPNKRLQSGASPQDTSK